MAKPNYQFQKRQKELEKKKKNEEKLQRKLDKASHQTTEDPDRSGDAVDSPAETEGA
jgi:Skp family chaperone for outer membrane proteins